MSVNDSICVVLTVVIIDVTAVYSIQLVSCHLSSEPHGFQGIWFLLYHRSPPSNDSGYPLHFISFCKTPTRLSFVFVC